MWAKFSLDSPELAFLRASQTPSHRKHHSVPSLRMKIPSGVSVPLISRRTIAMHFKQPTSGFLNIQAGNGHARMGASFVGQGDVDTRFPHFHHVEVPVAVERAALCERDLTIFPYFVDVSALNGTQFGLRQCK